MCRGGALFGVLRRDTKAEAQRAQHTQQGRQARVTVRAQPFVKGGAANPGGARDVGHALGPGDHTKGLGVSRAWRL